MKIFSGSSRFILVVLFFSYCCSGQEVGTVVGGGMEDTFEVSPASADEGFILVVDFGRNTRKIKPLSDFPESMRFRNRKREVNGIDVVSKVPVREIRIKPLDGDGNLVEASKAKIVNIQYLDENGAVLESTTMQGQDK